MNYIQFTVPRSHEQELIGALRDIASSHGMKDMKAESKVPNTLVYFFDGNTSFTYVGARRHGDHILIDLVFRSAGLGGKLFRKLEPEIDRTLRKIYGESVTVEHDRINMIPFETEGSQ